MDDDPPWDDPQASDDTHAADVTSTLGDKAPIYAAASGVVAPAITVGLIRRAVIAGYLHPIVGLLIQFLVPLMGVLWLISLAWKLGLTGWDPLDRYRTRATVRDDIPAQFHDAMSHETLDEPKDEGKIPTNLFIYGLCYLVGVPVFALVFIL